MKLLLEENYTRRNENLLGWRFVFEVLGFKFPCLLVDDQLNREIRIDGIGGLEARGFQNNVKFLLSDLLILLSHLKLFFLDSFICR